MKVFITGIAGLIGAHLTRKLLDAGHSVMGLDDFSFSYSAPPPLALPRDIALRFEALLDGAEVQRCSTLEKTKMRDLVTGFQPDVVVHLAALPLVSVSTRHVEFAYASLSQGLVNLLEILRDTQDTQRFVYASSSMVYGNFEMDPMPEDGPKNPLNVYGGLKLAGEVMSRSYLWPTDIDNVVIRPSAVYGPTDQHRRVVQKFCESAFDGTPILLKTANDHIMDFTFVDDIAQGFFLACTHPKAANETFNITYGRARRLSDLAAVISAHTDGLKISSNEIDDADRPTRGSLSIEKAKRLLGYSPHWPLERGIPTYLNYLRTGALPSDVPVRGAA